MFSKIILCATLSIAAYFSGCCVYANAEDKPAAPSNVCHCTVKGCTCYVKCNNGTCEFVVCEKCKAAKCDCHKKSEPKKTNVIKKVVNKVRIFR